MNRSSFHIILPSNASTKIFPSNKPQCFKVKLPERIELEGNWEVGLQELQYPHSFNNFEASKSKISYIDDKGQEHRIQLQSTHFRLGRTLLSAIERGLDNEGKKHIKFSYDYASARITAICRPPYTLKLRGDIAVMLGFEGDIDITGQVQAKYPVNMDIGLYSLYVYTNIVQGQIVGDAKAQLLRIVQVEGSHGDIVTKTFDQPLYVPLLEKSFDTIEVDISRDTGEQIHFIQGKSICTLHFRRYL